MIRVFLRFLVRKYTLPLLASCLLLACCSEFPDSLSVPSFNGTLSVPLLDSTLQLQQLLDDNGSIVSDKLSGNYAIVKDFDFPTLQLGDSMNIQAISVNYSSTLNSNADLRAKLSSFGDVLMSMSQVDSSYAGSGTRVIAASDNTVRVPVKLAEGLQRVHFQSGALVINIKNNLPIDIELASLPGSSTKGIMLSTPGQANIVCAVEAGKSTIKRRGNPNSALELRIPLANAVIDKNSALILHTKTAGSNGSEVTYTEQSTFGMQFSGEGMYVQNASASLGAMPMRFDFDAALPAGTTISEGVIREFVAQLSIRNDFALSGNAELQFPQLSNQTTHEQLSVAFRLNARTTQNLRLTNGGQSYVISPDAVDKAQGGKVRSLHCVCTIQTEALPTVSDFKESQAISISGTISPIIFSHVSGYRGNASEVPFSVENSIDDLLGSDIDLGSTTLQKIFLSCDIENNSANAGILRGTATLLDDKGRILTERPINPTTINPLHSTHAEFQFDDVHLSSIPSRIRINGTLQSVNGNFTYSEKNTIRGKVHVRIPLQMKVLGGQYTTSSALSIDQLVRERLKSAQLLIEAHNYIPMSVGLVLEFYDENQNLIQRLPNDSEIKLQGASDGMAKTIQRVVLDSASAARVFRASTYRSVVRMQTDSTRYVQFKNTDSLALRLNLECTTLIH